MRLFSNRSQKTSKCGKNISDTLGYASCATFLFLPHFDVICDLLLNRRTATWNLFVKFMCWIALSNFRTNGASCKTIINRGDWLLSPANIKGVNKDGKIYVGRSTTCSAQSFILRLYTIPELRVSNTFLLVSSSERRKQLLCFAQGQGQKREQ